MLEGQSAGVAPGRQLPREALHTLIVGNPDRKERRGGQYLSVGVANQYGYRRAGTRVVTPEDELPGAHFGQELRRSKGDFRR